MHCQYIAVLRWLLVSTLLTLMVMNAWIGFKPRSPPKVPESSQTMSSRKMILGFEKYFRKLKANDSQLVEETRLKCDLKLSEKHSSWTYSVCNGRMGNQLSLLSLQLGIHFKYGSDIILYQHQFNHLKDTFDLNACQSDESDTFCTVFRNSKAF